MSLLAPTLAPSYLHLARLTTPLGVFEHAAHDVPRIEHGYCVDDVARALVVVLREPRQSGELLAPTETYLRFLEAAIAPNGTAHNRMDADGWWTDDAAIGDWWGRAVASLGFAAVHATEPFQRTRAMYAFLRAAQQRSPDVRASAFAVLGAAVVVRAHPAAERAHALLSAAIDVIPSEAQGAWEWPEPRLRYANATLAEALIDGGAVLGRLELVERGLAMLGFLLRLEGGDSGRLSLTGSSGRGPEDVGPMWDQQAIEAAALADACARAYEQTGDARWRDGVSLAWRWFVGDNDSGVPMYDVVSGAGYDGLELGGRNANCGAESTLAALGTLQRAREVGVA